MVVIIEQSSYFHFSLTHFLAIIDNISVSLTALPWLRHGLSYSVGNFQSPLGNEFHGFVIICERFELYLCDLNVIMESWSELQSALLAKNVLCTDIHIYLSISQKEIVSLADLEWGDLVEDLSKISAEIKISSHQNPLYWICDLEKIF